ncbi:MAG: DUF4203 domain-containing protein [Archaeoglobaceae archaeon]
MISSNVLTLAMLVIAGILLNMLGYRIFRLYSAIIGVFVGLVLGTYIVVHNSVPNPAVVVLFTSALTAAIFWLVYRAGLFVTGAAAGFFTGLYLLPTFPIYSYVLAVFGGLATILAERVMMIFITAAIGGTLITLATYMAVNGLSLSEILSDVRLSFDSMFGNPLLLLLWFSLLVMGLVTQLAILREKAEEE